MAKNDKVSGAPDSVGAPNPGKPGGHKSASADKKDVPRKRAGGRRTKASRAAATSGKEVADAASGKDD